MKQNSVFTRVIPFFAQRRLLRRVVCRLVQSTTNVPFDHAFGLLVFGNDDAATNAVLDGLIDGDVQINRFALWNTYGESSCRHGAGWH